MKILITDDDRSSRMFLKAFLNRSSHTVIEAGNGQEAIEAFESERPDLILMDVTMPVMTGYEAATIIKQRCGKSFVPILFLTALSDEASLVKCVESGGDDFMVKPFNSVIVGAKILAMQRILQMSRDLELYKQRTEQEIELTQHVFESLTKRMSHKTIPGLNHWMRPAGYFSGDLMIYDKSPSGKLSLMLGDFTGHGFSAAIGALPTSDIFFAMTRRDFKPADILAEINRKLREIMPVGQFCAAVFICCDPAKHQVEIFNGGLPPVLVLSDEGKVEFSIKSSNFALGVISSDTFKAEMVTLGNIDNHTLVLTCPDSSGHLFLENGLGFSGLAAQ